MSRASTRTLVVVMAFAGAVVDARIAHANDGCEPPSSGGSSSSSDDDDDNDSSSYDSGSSDSGDWGGGGSSGSSGSSAPTGCVDSTDITGFERCSRFGNGWSAANVPTLRFEFGGSARRLSLAHISFGGLVYHDGNPHTYELRAESLQDPSVVVGSFDMRVTGTIGDHLLVGVELSAFGGSSPAGSVMHEGLTLEAGNVAGLSGGVVGGIAVPFGPLRVRGEVLVGGRTLFVSATSRLADCVSTDREIVTGFVLEPRLAVEWFVSPWVSFEAWGGADVLDLGTVAGGARITFHARAFDAVQGD